VVEVFFQLASKWSTDKQTDSKILPRMTDIIVGVGNKQVTKRTRRARCSRTGAVIVERERHNELLSCFQDDDGNFAAVRLTLQPLTHARVHTFVVSARTRHSGITICYII